MPLPVPRHDKDRLDGPHSKVIMVLLGELSAGQLVQVDYLPRQHLGRAETYRWVICQRDYTMQNRCKNTTVSAVLLQKTNKKCLRYQNSYLVNNMPFGKRVST